MSEYFVIPNFIREYSKNYICIVGNAFNPYPGDRFIGRGSYECDLLAINKRRMVFEYEIKLSVADFRNDAKKGFWTRDKNREKVFVSKYDLLFSGQLANYFTYVMPKDVYEAVKNEIPEKAGVIKFSPDRVYDPLSKKVSFSHYKPARRLHKEPASDEMLISMMKKMQMRYEAVMWKEMSKKLKQPIIYFKESSLGAE